MTEPRPFRVGVNYWPARSAMGFWRSWNESRLNDDFARITRAGFDSVRLFLPWEDFQPTPEVVDSRMLGFLCRTLDAASLAGLSVMPTLFMGHMSGANWFPGWAVRREGGRQRFPMVCGGRVVPARPIDWYQSEPIRSSQIRLASECAAALAGHEALLAWDLGNENSNCVVPTSRTHARSWLLSITDAIRNEDPKSPITMGLHMEDLEEFRHLTPQDAAEACDFLTMHGYPGYASFTRGPTDERLLPFLAQLTRFLGGGKEVFFTEFGVPTRPELPASGRLSSRESENGPELVGEDEAADYVARGLRALVECGTTGAMLWCYSDYSSELLDQVPFDGAPHEGTFGMFRVGGAAKPAADAVSSFAGKRPRVAASPRLSEESFIDLSHDDYYDDPKRHLERLYRRYCAALGEREPFNE